MNWKFMCTHGEIKCLPVEEVEIMMKKMLEIHKESMKDKIKEIHRVVVTALLNPKFTHTSKECDYRLRADLFSLAFVCVMNLVWNNNQFDGDFKCLKDFVTTQRIKDVVIKK